MRNVLASLFFTLCSFLFLGLSPAATALASSPPSPHLYFASGPADCGSGGVKVSSATVPGGACLGGSGTINPIYRFLHILIQFLSGMVGLVIVLILVVGGFQYVLAGANPDEAKSAKNRIKAAVTGFVLFIIMVAVLQVILPVDVKIFGT